MNLPTKRVNWGLFWVYVLYKPGTPCETNVYILVHITRSSYYSKINIALRKKEANIWSDNNFIQFALYMLYNTILLWNLFKYNPFHKALL